MEIIPIRELKNTVNIEKLCKKANKPIFVTKNGKGRLVIMDIEYFEKLFNEAYIAHEVNKGLKDIEDGNVEDAGKVLNEIKTKYGI